MIKKIFSFFMAIFTFFASLFGFGGNKSSKCYIYSDLKYGTGERQTLDLYVPKSAGGKSCGLALFIHGGAWISGDKSSYGKDTLKKICEDMGVAAAAMNYRYISDSVSVHDIMDDIDSALKAIRVIGNEKDISINRVMLSGYSAGAHLSLLYGYSHITSAPMKIACIVSNCGPTDLADPQFYSANSSLASHDFIYDLMSKACGYRFNKSTFGKASAALAKASPLTYVTSSCPPTIITHGKKDTTVPYSNAVALDAALSAVGVKHDFISYPNSDHSLANDPDCRKKADELINNYALAYLVN